MGIFSFVKDAGKKLFGGDEEEQQQKQQEATREEQLAKLAAARRNRLAKELSDHELTVEGLEIDLDGDKVTVRGTVESHELREKVILALGNVGGVGTVEDALEVKEPEAPPAVFYTVQSGDTLSKIAKHHYGKANAYMRIFEANKPMLKDPDKIYPGQTLRIPQD